VHQFLDEGPKTIRIDDCFEQKSIYKLSRISQTVIGCQTTIPFYSLRLSDRDQTHHPCSVMKGLLFNTHPYIFIPTFAAWVLTISLDEAQKLPPITIELSSLFADCHPRTSLNCNSHIHVLLGRSIVQKKIDYVVQISVLPTKLSDNHTTKRSVYSSRLCLKKNRNKLHSAFSQGGTWPSNRCGMNWKIQSRLIIIQIVFSDLDVFDCRFTFGAWIIPPLNVEGFRYCRVQSDPVDSVLLHHFIFARPLDIHENVRHFERDYGMRNF
jgi:hypothetical protein